MSTTAAALTVLVSLTISLGGTYAVLRWAMPAESTRDRLIREAHARAVVAHEIDDLELAYNLPALDPAWDAGRERLWDAVRDNQHKGEDA